MSYQRKSYNIIYLFLHQPKSNTENLFFLHKRYYYLVCCHFCIKLSYYRVNRVKFIDHDPSSFRAFLNIFTDNFLPSTIFPAAKLQPVQRNGSQIYNNFSRKMVLHLRFLPFNFFQGDIIGPALTNLDGLLEMPFGCGEQNMAKLAPNIFIMDYLTNTNQVTKEIRDEAIKYMRTGTFKTIIENIVIIIIINLFIKITLQ